MYYSAACQSLNLGGGVKSSGMKLWHLATCTCKPWHMADTGYMVQTLSNRVPFWASHSVALIRKFVIKVAPSRLILYLIQQL